MNVRMRHISSLSAAALIAVVATAPAASSAWAQTVEGQVGVASQYVGKGLGKSDGEPSVFGSVEVSQGDFYGSVFVSTAKLSQGSDSEIVSAIGYRPSAAGFDFDLSVVNRDLPGTRAGLDAHYWENPAAGSRRLGPGRWAAGLASSASHQMRMSSIVGVWRACSRSGRRVSSTIGRASAVTTAHWKKT